MELDATAGSATANSYVTLAAATALLEGRLHTEPWRSGPQITEDNTSALLWATRLLDEQVDWYGTPTTTGQALAWPQTGQVDPHGHALDPTTIPRAVQLATALYALALRRDTSEDAATGDQAGLASVRVGDTQVVYREQARLPALSARGIPAEVRSILAPYGTMTGGINIPLLRV